MTHKEKMEFWAKRAENIQKLRNEGQTLASIGKKFGLDRQRVHQILARLANVDK